MEITLTPEAEAVVRSLTLAMRGDQRMVLPLLKLKQFDQYTTTHALNVAVLSMGLAESLGCRPREIRAIGASAPLHSTERVASISSDNPANERPRNAASVSASRAVSMSCKYLGRLTPGMRSAHGA